MSAIFALRGYRTQFLYSLYRILEDYDKEYIFDVEGEYEDLDILDENRNYVESIQVKNKNGILNFSDLFSTKDSFFKRSIKLISTNKSVKIKIVSFGKVSEDLSCISKLEKKLKKKGLSEAKVKTIISNYEKPQIVNENDLENDILKSLKEFSIFTNPKIALELLLFWIYQSGENQKAITTKSLIEDLNKIGKFINEQDSFHKQFGKTIITIGSKSIKNENINQLKEGFYFGVSARYEHILANLDILRVEKLDAIHKSFNECNIVFIHGASGQGKSTLAYRYLHDYSNKNVVYELKLSNNFNEIYETINSLEALSKGLHFPITIYFDVAPQNNHWSEILKELSNKNNLQFLITIRQEDWNRTVIGDEFDFNEIELSFDKEEAEIIYNSLSEYKTDLKFTDFQESWIEFEKKGMLLEYVYLINQGDKLKIRLQNQINRLEKEKQVTELEILRYVCLSDAFNSKIDYYKIIDLLGINKSLSNSFIKSLEKEYLLKFAEDKRYLIGLHPIRSRLLCEILFDENEYISITSYINNSISLVDDVDLHTFLLNSFDKGYDVEDLLNVIYKIKFDSWISYINVFRALLWIGVRKYTLIDNIEVFKEAHENFKGAWWIFIVIDFTGMRNDNSVLELFKTLHKNNEEVAENRQKIVESLTNQLTEKETAFDFCNRWLDDIYEININPKNPNDFKSLGEFMFWTNFLKKEINFSFDIHLLHSFFQADNSELESKSLILLGLKSVSYFETDDSKIKELEDNFIIKFRKKYNVPVFLDDGKNLDLRYFFDVTDDFKKEKKKLDYKSSNPELDSYLDDELPPESSNIFNEKSMEIIELLRKAFPDRLKFKVKGIGYNFTGVEMGHDPTSKNISIENLPLSFLTEINRLIINFFDFQNRFESWKDYVEEIIVLRKNHLNALIEFRKGLILYFKKDIQGIDYLIEKELIIKNNILNEYQKLPKIVTDKWCYYGDSSRESVGVKKIAYSLSKYKKITALKRDYFSSLSNYINHSYNELVNTLKRLNGKEDEVENSNLRNLSEVVLFDSFLNLVEFQQEFQDRFEKYYDAKEIDRIFDKETNVILSLFTIWKAFIYSPYRYQPSILKLAQINFKKTKLDFKSRLYKECAKQFKDTDYLHSISTDSDDKSLFFLINVEFDNFIDVLAICFELVMEVFGEMHHSSLKKLITKLNFEKIIFIPLVNGNPVHDKFYEISVSNIDYLRGKFLEGYQFTHLLEIFNIPDDVNKNVLNDNQIKFWNELIPEIKVFEEVVGLFSSIQYLDKHIEELNISFNKTDSEGNQILKDYFFTICNYVNTQIILEVEPKLIILKTKFNNLDDENYLKIEQIENLQKSFKEYNTVEYISENNYAVL